MHLTFRIACKGSQTRKGVDEQRSVEGNKGTFDPRKRRSEWGAICNDRLERGEERVSSLTKRSTLVFEAGDEQDKEQPSCLLSAINGSGVRRLPPAFPPAPLPSSPQPPPLSSPPAPTCAQKKGRRGVLRRGGELGRVWREGAGLGEQVAFVRGEGVAGRRLKGGERTRSGVSV